MKRFKRPLSILLSVAMLLQMGLTPAFASESIALGTSTVCPHHVHDESCGYAEGTPCGHEHTDECYKEITTCIHEHTDACYPADEDAVSEDAVSEDAVSESAIPSDAPEKEPTSCTHICDEENGCVTREPDCKHVHDADCGYTEAALCTFDPADCALCTPADNGTAAQVVTGFVALDYKTEFQSVPAGTARNALDLPDTLIAHLEGAEGAQPVTGVTWAEDGGRSDPAVYDEAAETGAYVFTAVLPEGFTLAPGVSLPEINVMVGVTSPMAVAAGETVYVDTSYTGSGSDGSEGKPYTTLDAATTAIGCTDGCTIKLLSDIDLGSEMFLVLAVSLTLDLNGRTLSSSGGNCTVNYINAPGKTLTVQDSGAGGKIENTGNGRALVNDSTGTVDITGGTAYAKNNFAVTNLLGSTLNISGGAVVNSTGNDSVANYSTDTVTYTGGLIWGSTWGNNIPDGMAWSVKGDQTLSVDATLPVDKALTILDGSALTIAQGVTVTNNGTITAFGTLNYGAPAYGTITGGGKIVQHKDAQSTGISLLRDGAVVPKAEPGAPNTLRLTVEKPPFSLFSLFEEKDKANFYVGTNNTGTLINTTPVTFAEVDGKLVAEVAWTPTTAMANTSPSIFVEYGKLTAGGDNFVNPGTAAGTVAVSGVAEVDNGGTKTEYATLDAATTAIAAAAEGSTLKLLANIDLGNTGVTIGDISLTLDLNGKTLTSADENCTLIYASTKTLTVQDSSATGGNPGTGKVKNTSASGRAIKLPDAGTAATNRLVVTGGTVESTGNTSVISNNSTGGVSITGGKVLGAGASTIYNYSTGALTISGGTVENTGTGAAVVNESSGLVTISGTARIIGANGNAVSLGGSATETADRLVVTGGTLEAADIAIYNSSAGGASISGGAVLGAGPHTIYNYSTGTVTFTGGLIWGDCIAAIPAGIPAGMTWSVKGDQTLSVDATLPADKTFTILSGNTLTIPAGVTLTNSGALKLYGTLSGTGTLAGSGSFTAFGSEDITIPDQHYTGGPITPAPTLSATRTVMGKAFTVDKSGYSGPVFTSNTELGTATATYTYTADPSLTIVKTFTILQSGTKFDGGITTDKTDKTYTYGETITVTVTPKATGAAPAARRAAPTAGQMALFLGDTQVSDAAGAVSGTYTMTIDTKDKTLAAGSNTITAKYVGTASMADYSDTVTVTLNPQPIASATVNAGTTKVYDGTAAFTGVALTPNAADIFSGDTVTATAAGNAAGVNAGTHSFTATAVTLSGAQGSYYSLAASAVSGNVEITTATPTVKVTAAAKPKSFLRSIIGDHNDTIVLTATTGGANGEKPNGSVVFKNGGTTLATVDTTNGVATCDWANPPAGSFTMTAEFTASSSETNYIQTAVTGTADSFDISKGAQSALTVHVPALTYGDTGKSLTTSGGSTGGTVSYTITGDCVTVGADGAITVVKAGTATVTATMLGNSDFNDVTSEAAIITVDPATPTISWGADTAQTVTYTGTAAVVPTPPTVTGIAVGDTSNGTITYQHKSTSAKLTNLFGLLEGYTAGLPTDAGEYKIIATVAADGNYKTADSGEMTLTISKITSTLAISSMAGKTYDGTVIANPTNITSNITNPAVTYTYYKDNGSGAKGDKLNDAPKDAGNYWVEGDIAETGNTTAVTSAAVSFTVAQAPLTITGGTVTRREYDGTTAAAVTALTFGGLQSGETLAMTTDYTVGTPVYDSADAGTDKTVTGTAALAASTKAGNYSLTGGYTITGQTIDKKTGIAAPTGVTMDDTTTTKSFTFGPVSGYTDVTAYEWKLHTAAAWTAVTANPITFGNRAGNMQIRVKEAANYAAGAIYTHDTAFTATLEGSVSIDGTAAFGETLTAKPTGTQAGAVLSYEWKSGTTVLQAKSTNDTYKIAGTEVGKVITVEVTAASYTGSLTASTTAVAKKTVTATAGTISKVYDGTTAVETADQTLTIAKVNVSDDITVTMPSAAYDSKNTGSGRPIAVGDLAITGAAKDWYTVTAPTGVTGEITAKPLTAATVTVNGSYTYNGTAQTPAAADVTVMDGTTTLTNGTDYTYTAVNHTNAGTAAVNVTFQGNYSGTASGTFAIGKAPLAIAGYTAEDKDYDGKTAATVSAVTFTGLQNSESLALTTDYTASASFATKDADTGIAVSGTATLTNSDKAKNYSLASGALSGQSADITAIAPSYNVAAQKIKIENSLTAVQRLQSATGVSNETVEGALTWSETSGGAALDDTFTFEGSAGDVITLYWTFAPTSGNYNAVSDSTAFTLTDKDVPILTVGSLSKTYDGTAVTTVSGTAVKADGTGIPGTFAFDGAPLMKDAGTYNAVVRFTPTDTANYETASIVITVTIEKATITIKAKDKSAFAGDAVPTFTDADYTVSGLISGETLTTLPSLDYAATPDMSKAGSVAIIVSGAAAPDGGNYNDITYQSGKLTISSKGGGGGSSSGGSSAGSSLKSLPKNYKGATKTIHGVTVPDYVVEATWVTGTDGSWSLLGADGAKYVNTWVPAYNPYADVKNGQSAFDWYIFNQDGFMVTGWHTDSKGDTYYLNPVSNNSRGSMATGWKLIDGNYYYFEEEGNGTRGKMFWDTMTPDGYYVDKNGIWDKKKAKTAGVQ